MKILDKSRLLCYNKGILIRTRKGFIMQLLEQLLAENQALKVQLEQQEVKLKKLEALNDYYLEMFKLSQKQKFGASSEKAPENQLTIGDVFSDMFNEAETLQEAIMPEPTEETVIPKHTRKKAKRGSKFDTLATETIHYDLSEEEKTCDVCGEQLTEMKTEVRKELIIIPAQVKVVEHITHTYSCRPCDKEGLGGFIKTAPTPKALIAKSVVSPSLLAYILNQKYTNAMPLYRQEQEFKRFGIQLTRQNLSNWTLKGATLLKPLVAQLKASLLTNDLLHADETTLEVLREPDKEATSKSYMWVYRTSHATEHPVVLYDYQKGRAAVYVKEYLKEWQGTYLHCDGYQGYKLLTQATLCGCLVHAKRKFHEAWKVNPQNEAAKRAEGFIQKLFSLENRADALQMSYDKRFELRQNESKEVLDDFYTYLESLKPTTLPQSLLGKAIKYAENQKEYLSNFLKDPRIQLSNNLAEQSVKPFVIGRKNWLFANTPNGATSSAIIYSVIQTALANHLKPWHYLTYVFEQLQMNQNVPVEDLLPWSDKIPESCKNDLPQS